MAHKSKDNQKSEAHDFIVLKWVSQHEDGLQLTERNKLLCGGFHPAIGSDLLRGWVPIKAMANINDKWGNRDN